MARSTSSTFALAVLLAVGPGGCESRCGDGDAEPVLYTEGTVESTAQGRVYMSTPPDGRWLHFPAQRRFLLRHGLGAVPHRIGAHLSFDEQPLAERGGGLSAAAGNEAIVGRLTEDELIIKNDTCSEFYLLVQLEVSDSAEVPQAGRAGAGGAP